MTRYDEELNSLIEVVLRHIDLHKNVSDTEMQGIIAECVGREVLENPELAEDEERLRCDIRHAICRYGILQAYLEDESVTEIMVNGTNPIFVERNGRLECTEDRFPSAEKLEDIIRRIVAGCNRMVNEAVPIVDARMPGGERVCAIVGSVAVGGPYLTIRKFARNTYGVDDLVAFGSMPYGIGELLKDAVRNKQSIIISGSTGSGKTTLLSALAGSIPSDERVVSIEDSAEMKLDGIANLVRLETRNPNMEGKSGVTIRELLRASLRMRPDRIIVGEVRGVEVLDMLQAMNTGHAGSLSTLHSNSARDALVRLETMALMDAELPLAVVRRQIASGISMIVHLSRAFDGGRYVSEILKITGITEGEIHTEYIYQADEGTA